MFWTALSGVGQLAGGFMSAIGNYKQGKQAQSNAYAEAEALDDAADEERAARAVESGNEQIQSARQTSGMQARYAKSGLSMEGTPVFAMIEQAKTDAFNIQSKDRVSSIRADDMNYQGQLLRYQGDNARKASRWSALTSVIGGAAGAAGTVASFRNAIGKKSPVGEAAPAIADRFKTGPFNFIGNNGMLS